MASTNSRGNYYKKKTQKWFEDQGYEVQLTEFSCGQIIQGRCFYRKIDVFSSDMICMNGKEIIFVNSKHITNPDTSTFSSIKSQGLAEFRRHRFPKPVKRQLVIWQPRVKEPTIIQAT